MFRLLIIQNSARLTRLVEFQTPINNTATAIESQISPQLTSIDDDISNLWVKLIASKLTRTFDGASDQDQPENSLNNKADASIVYAAPVISETGNSHPNSISEKMSSSIVTPSPVTPTKVLSKSTTGGSSPATMLSPSQMKLFVKNM